MQLYNTEVGDSLEKAAEFLRLEEVVAIPTETVYGLAGNAFSDRAVKGIFAAKNRPFYNPLIVHLADKKLLSTVARDIPAIAYQLLDAFAPGPLTLLLPKKAEVPDLVTAGLPMVALRFPEHPMTIALLKMLDFPLAAPSANPFGYISPTTAEHVMAQLGGRIPYILDGGSCEKGIESTIVGFEGERIIVHRLGALSLEELQVFCPDLILKDKASEHPVGPGMLPHHYSPNTQFFIVDDLKNLPLMQWHPSEVGVLAMEAYLPEIPTKNQVLLSATGNLEEAAQGLYAALHFLDGLGLKVIFAQKMPPLGAGRAINDRLERAAAKWGS